MEIWNGLEWGRKSLYQDKDQITGAWAQAKEVTWENISDKPLPWNEMEGGGEAHSDLQDSIIVAVAVKVVLTYLSLVLVWSML